MRYFIVLTLFWVIILSDCSHPEGTLQLAGKVVDRDSDIPIPHRTIIVLTAKSVSDFDSGYVIGHFITDSLGGFSYRLQKVRNVYFYNFLVVKDKSYASSDNVLGLTELKQNGKFLSFKIRKLTDLSINIVSISNQPNNDILYVSWKSDKTEGKTLYPYKVENNGLITNNRLKWTGGKVNSVIKTKVYATKPTVIKFELFRDRKYKEFVIEVFCKENIDNSVLFKY
jgi:hypothetical protein